MKIIKDFLEKKTDKNKIIVIYWPTWSWKTSMSIDIASYLDTEIISTDSKQVFKYMDIWTWKISENEKQWIIHHMLDIINPDDTYSVWEYKTTVECIIKELHIKDNIPVLCWWTWLYIDSLIYDFDIPKMPSNDSLREDLENEAKKYWNEYIYKKLQKLDPEYSKLVHPNNLRYVIRWLEVKLLTWKSKLDSKKEKELKYDTLFLTPYNWDRETLYYNINKRVKWMFDEWLIDEVKWLLNKGYKKSDFWMKSIWYKETLDYLEWNFSLEETIDLVRQSNRNYAKRQLTRFSKYPKD